MPGRSKPTKRSTTRAPLKTRASRTPAATFFAALGDARRAECETLDRWLSEATGEPGVMWGTAIVGYGQRVLRYESGRELEWMRIGFSPRKQALTLYLVDGLEAHAARLAKLGPHKTGKGCLYVSRLADVDGAVLRSILRASAKASR